MDRNQKPVWRAWLCVHPGLQPEAHRGGVAVLLEVVNSLDHRRRQELTAREPG